MMKKRRTKGHPILPIKLFDKICDMWGEDAAIDILDLVQEERMSIEDVEKAINRPDISVDDWKNFEDGWRPDNW